MRTPRLREITMLIVSGGMVAIGFLGLTGVLGESPVLIAVLLVTLVAVSFFAGRKSMQFTRP